MDQATAVETWGAYNLWDLYDLHKSTSIRVTSPANFLHFLFSEGTRHITHNGYHVGKGFVDFKLYGPITDDAKYEGKKLFEGEVNGKHKSDAIERCCLYIQYRLYREDLKGLLITPEEKHDFAERLRGNGLGGVQIHEILKTLGVKGE
jgi:hypothetical protein